VLTEFMLLLDNYSRMKRRIQSCAGLPQQCCMKANRTEGVLRNSKIFQFVLTPT